MGVVQLVTSMKKEASQKDFYSILGVDRSASELDIRKAYKRKAIRRHPSHGGPDDDKDSFKDCTEAYYVLSDKSTREYYDRTGNPPIPLNRDMAFFNDECFQNNIWKRSETNTQVPIVRAATQNQDQNQNQNQDQDQDRINNWHARFTAEQKGQERASEEEGSTRNDPNLLLSFLSLGKSESSGTSSKPRTSEDSRSDNNRSTATHKPTEETKAVGTETGIKGMDTQVGQDNAAEFIDMLAKSAESILFAYPMATRYAATAHK